MFLFNHFMTLGTARKICDFLFTGRFVVNYKNVIIRPNWPVEACALLLFQHACHTLLRWMSTLNTSVSTHSPPAPPPLFIQAEPTKSISLFIFIKEMVHFLCFTQQIKFLKNYYLLFFGQIPHFFSEEFTLTMHERLCNFFSKCINKN